MSKISDNFKKYKASEYNDISDVELLDALKSNYEI